MDNQATARNLTLWELLTEYIIEIPIIQRDYAQGRKANSTIRNNILESFHKALTTDQKLELDFIYASKSGDVIQPLDGQQRLTTLFLLHWYVCTKENKLTAQNQEILKKFTYETRTSSREFCQYLIESQINDLRDSLPPYGALINPEQKDSKEITNFKLSNAIKNASWFVLSWQKDPTIKAMLNMLDAIDDRFKSNNNLWQKLTAYRVISFSYLTLEQFGLSDDLYIKMNARGKALTDFENFKAILEKKINYEQWEDSTFQNQRKFADKVDTDWTEFLWHYKDEKFLIDDAFMKVVGLHLITQIKGQETNDTLKAYELNDKITKIYNHPNSIMPEDFDKETFNFIVTTLDNYAKANISDLSLGFPVWQLLPKDSKSKNFFESLFNIDKNKTYPQVIMSYAQTLYLINNEDFDKVKFSDWMRVVRNIVLNATIDSAEPFVSATNLVKDISMGSSDIYLYLSNNNVQSNFARNQVQEEILKAKIIAKRPESKASIQKIEDTDFSKGHIGFVIHCLSYEDDPETLDIELIDKITKIFEDNFSGNDDFDNKIRRALLTIGDNRYYDYWWSWLFAVDSQKRCLIENLADLRDFAYKKEINGENGIQFRDYLKILILQLTEKNIDNIINEFEPNESMPKWKIALIKNPELMEFSKNHYFAKTNDESQCWLIPGKRVENSEEGRSKLLDSDKFDEYLSLLLADK